MDSQFQNGAATVSLSPLPIKAANMSVMHKHDHTTFQLPYVQDQKLLMLCWCSFQCIILRISTDINNRMHTYFTLLAAFLNDCDSALWQSGAPWYSCMGHCWYIEIYVSLWNMHFAHYRLVYQQIFRCDFFQFSNDISVSEILSEVTWRTWWKHIDLFFPTVLFPYSFFFRLHWPSQCLFQVVSVFSVLAKSIWEYIVWHTHPAALGCLYPHCHCLALHQIYCLPLSRLCLHLYNPSRHASHTSLWCCR